MFPIIEKTVLNPSVVKIKLDAPLIAKKVLPGQFIIFRIDEYGERVPLTVADYDREAGTITLIFQIVGHTTERRCSERWRFHSGLGRTFGRGNRNSGGRRICLCCWRRRWMCNCVSAGKAAVPHGQKGRCHCWFPEQGYCHSGRRIPAVQ